MGGLVESTMSGDLTLSAAVAETVKDLFTTLDADRSGTIDVDELKAAHGGDHDRLFAEIDLDSDGCITWAEFEAFFLTIESSRGARACELLCSYLKVNCLSSMMGGGVTLLPVCQLLLDGFKMTKPETVESPRMTLGDAHADRAT